MWKIFKKQTCSLILLPSNDLPQSEIKVDKLIDGISAFLSKIKHSYKGGYSTFKLILMNIIWWWHLGYKDGWSPYSVNMLGWFVKIRSLQKDKFGRKCVGSEITWLRP